MTEFWYYKKSKSTFRLAVACTEDLSPQLGVHPKRGYYRATAPRDEAKRLLRWLKKNHGPVDIHKGELPPEVNTVHLGDCLGYLRELPDNCIDLVCSDPPYGLNFMQKNWDRALPPQEVWEECYRVLKPGAFAFVMCTPRQDCLSRMILRLEEAGFFVSFTSMYWTYFTGFPKAQNLSKAADKKAVVDCPECDGEGVIQYGGKAVVVDEDEDGEPIYGSGPSYAPCTHCKGKGKLKGAKRKVVGYTGLQRKGVPSSKERSEMHQQAPRDPSPITLASTDEAKRLDGSYGGFQPKPAVEPIIVVMKPLDEKTFLAQALANGKGCTWLDDCRVPGVTSGSGANMSNKVYGSYTDVRVGQPNVTSTQGRFPANLLVSDDVLNDGDVRSSGKMRAGVKRKNRKGYTGPMPETTGGEIQGDTGSPSRFFDLDAWFLRRFDQLPKNVQKVFPYLMVPKAPKKEKNAGLEGKLPKKVKPQMGEFKTNPGRKTPKSSPTARANHHPTVKPVALFTYLVTLGSRPGDIVLDPFLGSGTTGIAAITSKRKFIGMEQEEEYVDIAVARIKYAMTQAKKASKGMKRLFGRER